MLKGLEIETRERPSLSHGRALAHSEKRHVSSTALNTSEQLSEIYPSV